MVEATQARSKRKPICIHCGTPVGESREEKSFCCNGCEYVYRLIHNEGLERFYELKDRSISPVNAEALRKRDYSWLEELVEKSESKEGVPHLRLELQGISCVGCVWLIEKLFQKEEGARRIEINAQLGQLRMEWVSGQFDAAAFAHRLQEHGYRLGAEGQPRRQESGKLVHRIGLCAAFAANAMLFTLPSYLGMAESHPLYGIFQLLVALFATLSLLTGGIYFIQRAISGLQAGILSIDLPLALGITGAYLGSVLGWILGSADLIYFDFVSIFIFLMLSGRWLQEAALERNRNALLSRSPQPQLITVPGSEDADARQIGVEAVEIGQEYILQPESVNPVCAKLESDSIEVSLEWINGEPDAREFTKGQRIPSGAILLSTEKAYLLAEENWEQSLLHRLLVPAYFDYRNRKLECILKYYISAVLLIALGGGLYWWVVQDQILTGAQVALSILVVSCPCGLGVAWPLADEWSASLLRRCGVFLREMNAFARLKSVRQIIFDKTGTLTLASPLLDNPEELKKLGAEEMTILKRLTANSLHPVSRSLSEALLNLPEIDLASGFTVEEEPGMGLCAQLEGTSWSLGRPGWRGGRRAATGNWLHQCEFCRDGKVLAEFTFSESLREDAGLTVRELAKRFRIILLSGDRRTNVGAMAMELGIPPSNALGELTPEEKEAWVMENLPEETLFVGDGANDSLAFNRSAVRLAPMTDRSVLESKADYVFTGRGLNGVTAILTVAARRARILRNVFLFTVTYNLSAIAVCLAGLMNPVVAAIIMPLSSILTTAIVAWGFRRGFDQ